ncbi:uncharacterized protein LOC144863905 [Branchiostoma floridae x Branchiostoma japonicum]
MVESAYITQEWPKGVTPEFSWSCAVQKTTGTQLPHVDVIFNSTRADMKKYPGLKEEWYTEGKGSDRRILIVITFPHFDTTGAVVLNWTCKAEVESETPGFALGIQGANLIVYPIGCPKGKYGGECEYNCSCPHNATCHTFNGACKCPDGWEGNFCENKIPVAGSNAVAIVLSVLLLLLVVAGLAWWWKRRTDRGAYKQMFEDI